MGRCWQIPEDAKKPADGRVTSGKYIKRYDTEMKGEGVRDILKLGVAFSGKKVCVKIK